MLKSFEFWLNLEGFFFLVREKRQTLMYSATFPDPIQKLAMNILNFYLFCRVGVVGAANTDVSQKLVRIRGREKKDKLIEMLRELRAADEKRILIFVSRKKSADFLGMVLSEEGFKVRCSSVAI